MKKLYQIYSMTNMEYIDCRKDFGFFYFPDY